MIGPKFEKLSCLQLFTAWKAGRYFVFYFFLWFDSYNNREGIWIWESSNAIELQSFWFVFIFLSLNKKESIVTKLCNPNEPRYIIQLSWIKVIIQYFGRYDVILHYFRFSHNNRSHWSNECWDLPFVKEKITSYHTMRIPNNFPIGLFEVVTSSNFLPWLPDQNTKSNNHELVNYEVHYISKSR